MHICSGRRGAQEGYKNNKDLPKQIIFQVDIVRHRNILKSKYGKHAILSIFSQLGHPSLEPALGLLWRRGSQRWQVPLHSQWFQVSHLNQRWRLPGYLTISWTCEDQIYTKIYCGFTFLKNGKWDLGRKSAHSKKYSFIWLNLLLLSCNTARTSSHSRVTSSWWQKHREGPFSFLCTRVKESSGSWESSRFPAE